ncbi:MAG: PAS domain S-box protein [Kofleriaceae bacterium]|nr:PAS domain S-box protein [Kofleriaceae bacterium]
MLRETDPKAELRFRELVESAPDGIVVCDRSGAIVLVNAQTERMFGYSRGELIGKPIEILIPERLRSRHPGHVAGYTGAPRSRPMGTGLDLSGRRRDGTEFPVEISLSPIQVDQGTLFSAAIRDVSDRKRIEAEARRANAYLLSSVDSIQDAFSLYDEEDRVVLVNSSFRQLVGASIAGAIVGRRFDELADAILPLLDPGSEAAADLRRRWLDYHREPTGSLELRTRTGRTLRITDRATAEHGTVSLIVDITDDILRAEELRRARQQAEAASAAKSEFLASMSHELRTPLNAILGFAQLLQRDRKQPLSERQLERLGHVLSGGEHLLRLIDEVLDLARIEAGGIAISTEPVGVRDMVAEVVTTLEPMAQRAGIQLASEITEVADVVADRTRLAQILMNFGSNAIKYNRQGGHVAFRAAPRDSHVRLSVVDDGFGIPEDKRAKIFEPFQRAGQETGPIEGTGIGLSISKRLAELMQGSVGFTSVVDRGSEFWVDIPVHVAAADTEAARKPQVAEGSALAAAPAAHKVVYVEDNPSNIAFMRELMSDLPAVELLTAPTAEIGVELVRAQQPAAVIMDINLPGMSGFDAVKLLKAWPETTHIPVIALSAAALARDTSRAREAGFYRYLTKPVKIDELLDALNDVLDS